MPTTKFIMYNTYLKHAVVIDVEMEIMFKVSKAIIGGIGIWTRNRGEDGCNNKYIRKLEGILETCGDCLFPESCGYYYSPLCSALVMALGNVPLPLHVLAPWNHVCCK